MEVFEFLDKWADGTPDKAVAATAAKAAAAAASTVTSAALAARLFGMGFGGRGWDMDAFADTFSFRTRSSYRRIKITPSPRRIARDNSAGVRLSPSSSEGRGGRRSQSEKTEKRPEVRATSQAGKQAQLPEGWTMVQSRSRPGEWFYYHEASKTTSWTLPEDTASASGHEGNAAKALQARVRTHRAGCLPSY